MCLVTLEIIPKTIWNCIRAFFRSAYKNTSRIWLIILSITIFICYWEKFINLLGLLHNLTSLSLSNSFLFTFTVFLKSLKKLQMVCYKSFLSRFSALINYIMWSFNLFTASSCFPHFSWRPGFSGSRFFRVQVFQGPGPASGSRFQK